MQQLQFRAKDSLELVGYAQTEIELRQFRHPRLNHHTVVTDTEKHEHTAAAGEFQNSEKWSASPDSELF